MAYAALSDIQGLMAKFTIDTASKPTAAQAGVIITQISAEIDGVIAGAGYSVPVASPTWFVDSLKLLNAYGATAAVLESMFPERAGGNDEAAALRSYYAAQYNRGIKRLQDGSGTPPDLATNSAR